MSIQKVEKLYLWTNGDCSVGLSGETAEVSAPGWLISSEDYDADAYKATLDEFRAKACEAFKVIWPNKQVYAMFDFEMPD